jgi:hypothetical protein
VLAYLFSLKHLELDDLSRPDDTAASTVLNYVHAIHMEVRMRWLFDPLLSRGEAEEGRDNLDVDGGK